MKQMAQRGEIKIFKMIPAQAIMAKNVEPLI